MWKAASEQQIIFEEDPGILKQHQKQQQQQQKQQQKEFIRILADKSDYTMISTGIPENNISEHIYQF